MFKSITQYVSTLLKLKTTQCLADVSVYNYKTKNEETVMNNVPFYNYTELETLLSVNENLQTTLVAVADVKRAGTFNKFITSKLVLYTTKINEMTIPHDSTVKKGSLKIVIECPPYRLTITVKWQ